MVQGSRQARSARLGVLLVHGMGSAEPGDTLRNIGEPLHDVLRRAPARAARVRVGDPTTVVLDGDDEQPAHVVFDVWPEDEPHRRTTWWMAECHWGDTFRPPHYRDVVTWIVLVLPWTLIGYFQTKRRHFENAQGTGARDAVLAVLALFGAVVLGPLIAAVLVLVLGLAVPLSRVPVKVLQAPAKALIRVLSASLGDVYMLASESFDRHAVDQRLDRDLRFLLDRCERVAVVAHSAGSYLTHCLLQRTGRSPGPGRVPLLVTYGQAVWRVHAVQNLDEGGGERRKAVLVSMGALLCGLATIGLVVADDWWPWPVVPALAGLGLCAWAFRIVRRASRVAESETGLGLAKPQRWRDYVASTDPVPNGVMPAALVTEEGRAPRSYEGVRIHNGRSVVSDHNGYDSNEDVFFNAVARDLLWAAGHDGEAQRADLHRAWVGRRCRTRWLSTARVTSLACAGWLLTVAGWSGGPTEDDASTAMRFGTWLVEKLPPSWTKSLFGISEATTETSLRAKLVGLAVLALLLVPAYWAIRSSWGSWDRRASQLALGPAAGQPSPASPPGVRPARTVFVVAWLAISAALVVITCVWHFTRPSGLSLPDWVAQRMPDAVFGWLTALLVLACALAAAITLSPARAGRDATVGIDWDPDRSAAPLPTGGPSSADTTDWQALLTLPDGWRAQLPDAEGRLTGVVHGSDRVCLESRWEGTPAGPLRTTTGPGAVVLSGCRLALRVAQVVQLRDGVPVTIAHYVDGALHPAPSVAPVGDGAGTAQGNGSRRAGSTAAGQPGPGSLVRRRPGDGSA